MNPSSDNSLNIRPLPPNGITGWGSTAAPTNSIPTPSATDSADAARQKIAAIGQPQFVGAVASPLATPRTAAQPGIMAPQPVSPAVEQLHTARKQTFSRIKPVLTALASFLLILALFKAPVLITQIKYLSSARTPTSTTPIDSSAGLAVPADPIITIPKINVSAPVIYPTSTANAPNYDPELEHGVVHFPNTALPGQNGNAVLFGHSSNDWWQPGGYKFIFVLLDKLVPGDTFSINYNSKRYIYEVTESKVVEATDVSVLNPTANPTVTLITCWPAGTALKREIIKAKQISPTPAASSGIKPVVQPSTQTLPGSASSFTEQLRVFWQHVKDGISNTPTNANTAPSSSTSSGSSSGLPGN